jgi:MFS transporter, putative metabolite:H+ symporter
VSLGSQETSNEQGKRMEKVQGLNARLDSLDLGPFHRRLLLVSGLGWMFDAMDVLLIGSILAALGQEWKLDATQRGYVLSVGFLGMFVGAALSGWLADRIGRKVLFQSTLILYSIATGLCALVPSPPSTDQIGTSFAILLVLRFVVGLGLGGELPVASTLVSEFSPARRRGLMVVLLESFWALGAVLAALIAYLLIPTYGWRIAFALGALPAFYVLVLRRGIPESARYLESKGRFAEAEAVVRQVETGVEQVARPTGVTSVAAGPTERTSVGDLFQGRYVRRTAMLWILWFGIVFSYYGVFTWLPSLLAQEHRSLTTSFGYVLVITLFQIPGYLSAVYLVERWGRKPTLALYLLVCAVAAYFFRQAGQPGASSTMILVWGSVLSFFNLGAWGVVYTYTPELYPTRVRATGAGFAAGFGRIGGIIGPYVVALLLTSLGMATEVVFVMFAAVFFIIAADVLVLGEETKGESLEELTT